MVCYLYEISYLYIPNVGKGENIWDRFTHLGGKVDNNDTGDVACDSYYKFKEDIQLMKDMGVRQKTNIIFCKFAAYTKRGIQ